jgi:hypothetical protein
MLFDYEAVINVPKHASNLINEYLNNAKPAKKLLLKEKFMTI